MSKKISVNLPDNIYEELVRSAQENTRTVSQEVLHRIRSTGIFYKDLTPKKATPKEAMAFAKEALYVEDSPQGEEVVKENKKVKLDKLIKEGLVTKGFSKADQLGWKHIKK